MTICKPSSEYLETASTELENAVKHLQDTWSRLRPFAKELHPEDLIDTFSKLLLVSPAFWSYLSDGQITILGLSLCNLHKERPKTSDNVIRL